MNAFDCGQPPLPKAPKVRARAGTNNHIAELRRKHAELDQEIVLLLARHADVVEVSALKRQKLALKEQIEAAERAQV